MGKTDFNIFVTFACQGNFENEIKKAGKGSGGIIEMTTSVYESTVLKMRGLEDTDLLVVCEFIDRLSSKNKIRKETNYGIKIL